MKVLFAVSNEEISESIVKKYQKQYKEIISYKNVYYFNAILKELQKDKNYDRIVISEDLEAFTSTQYAQIDKIIFDKLDNITDEASNLKGDDIPIILICSDRRDKSEEMLVKLFGIGIYNALIGNDRSIDNVCGLLNKPRLKKDAKAYYKIDADDVTYQSENENDVSEVEIQNILAHYKRLGKDEKKYIESFDNIASQYNDVQLRIISKFLPLNVRAVLEEKSTKYQQIISFNSRISDNLRAQAVKKEEKQEKVGTSEKLLNTKNNEKTLTRPVVIPSSVNMNSNVKLAKKKTEIQPIEEIEEIKPVEETESFEDIEQLFKEQEEKIVAQPENVKKKRGRPRKNPLPEEKNETTPKRGKGRPRKNPLPEEKKEDVSLGLDDEFENILLGFDAEEKQEDNILPGFDNEDKQEESILPGFDDKDEQEDSILPGFDDEDEQEESILPGFDNEDEQEESILPGFDNEDEQEDNILPGFDNEDEQEESILPGFDNEDEQEESILPGFDNEDEQEDNILPKVTPKDEHLEKTIPSFAEEQSNNRINSKKDDVDLSSLFEADKKVACFVGTSKNGTSFIVNNLAEVASQKGIDVAILDTTKNRNSYYIYTKNEEELRRIAMNSINSLLNGVAEGIQVNKNLTVYTSLPNETEGIEETEVILQSLLKKHSLILIDCDFETPINYFKSAQQIYLVQTFDVLTIQPLTAFLRELKAKNILDENKLRIVLNKAIKVRGIKEKNIIGGIAYYSDPAMSFMTELFNQNTIRYITMPFDEEVYTRYLEGIINCEISTKGYPKNIVQILNELSNMVYPLISGKPNKPGKPGKSTYQPPSVQSNGFTPSINSTLDKMKKTY